MTAVQSDLRERGNTEMSIEDEARAEAFAEAERRWPDPYVGRLSAIEDFAAGVVWWASRKPEVTDEAVEALQVAIEVEHRYTPVMMLSIEDTERRECECGEHFLSAESHRYHVYRAALSAALRVGGDHE